MGRNYPPFSMILLGRGTLISPLLATHTRTSLCAAKCASPSPFVCPPYALFHFPYPVSPVFATLTKTAGCVPTLPILKLAPPPASPPIGFPPAHPLESPRHTTQHTCT